jgi:hypothetical protein
VKGLALAIVLQGEDARPLGIRGIVLDHDGIRQATENVPNANVVSRELVIAVHRNTNSALLDERLDALQCCAHS